MTTVAPMTSGNDLGPIRICFIQYIAAKAFSEPQWQSSVALDWSNNFITSPIRSLESQGWLEIYSSS